MTESDVARVRREIALAYESANRMFTDFTPTASHELMNRRQEIYAEYFDKLRQHIPAADALTLLDEELDTAQRLSSSEDTS